MYFIRQKVPHLSDGFIMIPYMSDLVGKEIQRLGASVTVPGTKRTTVRRKMLTKISVKKLVNKCDFF